MVRYRTTAEQAERSEAVWHAGLGASAVVRYLTMTLLPLGFAVYAIACGVLLRHAPGDYSVDLAQPLVVVTYWEQFGAIMCAALFGGLAIAGVGYVRCLSEAAVARKQIVWIAGISCLIALCAPAVFSSDVYAYAAYGDLVAHGINPYAHDALLLRTPLLDAAQWQWGNPLPACVYGPLFVLLARIAVVTQTFGAAAPLWTLRILSCLALIGIARFAPLRTARIVALNPLAIWACAEGHNDIIAVAMALGGIALSVRRPFAGSFLAVFAGAVKLPALAAGAFVRSKFAALSALALCALLYAPLLLSGASAHRPQAFEPHFSPLYGFMLFAPLPLAITLVLACAAVTIAIGRASVASIALALWICIPNPYPWYAVWLLPLAAMSEHRAERTALIAASLFAALRYYGEATSLLPPAIELTIVICAYALPLAIFTAAGSDRARSGRPAVQTSGPDLAPFRLP